jgi:hypothetical protein
MSASREPGTTDRSSGERIMTVSMSKADSATPVPPAALPPDADLDSFVINLCSSTTPMALTQPQLAELKNFKFFVSRRLEDGRERFRLHMGYFETLLQAEDLLPMVREIYPGAWAGEAPGKRLRARAAAAKSAPAVAAPPAPAAAAPTAAAKVAPVASAPPAPSPVAGPSADVLANMPTLSAAPDGEPTRLAPAVRLELVADAPRRAYPVPAPEPAPEPAAAVAAAPASVAPPVAPAPKPAAPKTAAAVAPKRNASLPFDQRSNVREILKSLDEAAREATAPAATPITPAPKPMAPAPKAAAPVPKPVAAAAKPAAPSAKPAAAVPATPVIPAGPAVRQAGVLPDSKVLHLLEQKQGDPLNTTSTPAAFSVQLQWSVQPIDLARVPPLAIFGAYTLYTVEGSREGRRWFGLRLGFFSDANSAKQVAQYVRSEFSSVAVVPVSLKERDGASGASPGTAAAAAAPAATDHRPTERLPDQSAEFKLLDDTGERPKLPGGVIKAMQTRTAADAGGAKPRTAATGKTTGVARTAPKGAKGRGNRVNAHEKRAPKTLEETLEILGADELQMEGGRQLLSAGSIKHVDMKVQKNSAFSRLLDRLAERSR